MARRKVPGGLQPKRIKVDVWVTDALRIAVAKEENLTEAREGKAGDDTVRRWMQKKIDAICIEAEDG